MKNLFNLIIAISIISFTGCSEDDLCLIGSGKVENYELTTDAFDEISLIGPIDLRIKQGPELSLNVDAEKEIFSELTYAVKNGMLEIGFKENITCFETDHGVRVNVTLPNITAIYQSGVSEIISDGNLNLTQLHLEISGTADMELSGQVENHSIESSGVVNANNFGLQTKNTVIDISGTADIELSCSVELDIEVDGAAKISYKGNPTISQDVSGDLELINAN